MDPLLRARQFPQPEFMSGQTGPADFANEAPMRKYSISYIDREGHLRQTSRVALATATYEKAFCVLKEGTLLTTRNGFTTIEDVLPGDEVKLGDGSYDTVEWCGNITIMPDECSTSKAAFTRFTTDAMGYNRPSPDLVLGYGARILHRAGGIRRVSGGDAGFFPVADFVDGDTVLSLNPMTEFNVYQIGFAGQRSYVANGLEVESLHPGTAFDLGLRGTTLRSYLSLFPHKRSFEDFGMVEVPRLRLRDLELLD